LPDIVDDTLALVRHVREKAAALGFDGNRLCIAGHSSGGHLAGMTLVRLANENDLDGIACGYLESGNYDLRPLMLSYRKDYLHLSAAETWELSPLLMLDKALPPTLVVSGGGETDEFQRQSRTFCDAMQERGMVANLRIVPDANHFQTYSDLYEDDTPSWRFLEAYLGLPRNSKATE
jgi:arylformamidase